VAIVVAMMVQAGTVAGPPESRVELVPHRRCAPDNSGDIVVCARPEDGGYRLQRLPEKYRREAMPRAAAQLGGGATISGETEAATVGTFPSNRIMLRLKKRF